MTHRRYPVNQVFKILIPLPVSGVRKPATQLCMTLQVAGSTKRYKIALFVCPTVYERHNVMDLFCKRDPPFGIAVFADRMLPDIRIPDTLPCSAVLFLVAGPLISIVEMFFLLLVLGAILFTGLSKVGTPCHTAGASWAIWHQSLPRFFIKNRPEVSLEAILAFASSLHGSRF